MRCGLIEMLGGREREREREREGVGERKREGGGERGKGGGGGRERPVCGVGGHVEGGRGWEGKGGGGRGGTLALMMTYCGLSRTPKSWLMADSNDCTAGCVGQGGG